MIEKLPVFKKFPDDKQDSRLVKWLTQEIYAPIARRINWLLNRYVFKTFDSSDSPIDVASEVSFYLVDTTAGDVIANVPNAEENTGIMFHFKNIGTGELTVDAAELIDNCDTIVLIEMETVTIISDGTKYWIVP